MDQSDNHGSDNVNDPLVVNVANALEQEAIKLLHNEPLDTSGITAALSQFQSRPEQVKAMADAVQKINPAHRKEDPNIPPLQIVREKEGAWDAVRVWFDIRIESKEGKFSETLYTYPIGEPTPINNKQTTAPISGSGSESLDKHPGPEVKPGIASGS